MKENGFEREARKDNFTNHLKRFFDDSEETTNEAIQGAQSEIPEISKAELFRRLSHGKGNGKSHVSQFTAHRYDGKMKGS